MFSSVPNNILTFSSGVSSTELTPPTGTSTPDSPTEFLLLIFSVIESKSTDDNNSFAEISVLSFWISSNIEFIDFTKPEYALSSGNSIICILSLSLYILWLQ